MVQWQSAPGVPTGRRLGGLETASVVIAVLAHSLAVFSTLSDWAAWKNPNVDIEVGESLVSWRFGGWVAAYLVGLLLVELLVVVAIAGPAAFNLAARIGAVALALQVIVLVFIASSGSELQTRDREQVAYDSEAGPWLAILGLLGFALAAALAQRPAARRPVAPAPAPAGPGVAG